VNVVLQTREIRLEELTTGYHYDVEAATVRQARASSKNLSNQSLGPVPADRVPQLPGGDDPEA
jgi:hypothetical protein